MQQPEIFIYPDGRMDTNNAAQYLGKSRQRMAAWRVEGIGPRFTKLGGHIFYFKSDLDEWILSKSGLKSSGQARNRQVIMLKNLSQ